MSESSVSMDSSSSTQAQSHASELSAASSVSSVLEQQDFPRGVARAMTKGHSPLRFWLLDNGSSMRTKDSHRLLGNHYTNHYQTVRCTRWMELQETTQYHMELAGLLQVPTVFRLVNYHAHAQCRELHIGNNNNCCNECNLSVCEAMSAIKASQPRGSTPLSEHLPVVAAQIQAVASTLREGQQKAVVVLAVADLPPDQEQWRYELQNLVQSLPVHIIVRLSTSDARVAQFYRQAAADVPNVEVLEEYLAEARRLHRHNPWLNYSLPLHRAREAGLAPQYRDLFQRMGVQALERPQVLELLEWMLGHNTIRRATEWTPQLESFLAGIITEQGRTWNPITKKLDYWVDLKKLHRAMQPGNFFGLLRKRRGSVDTSGKGDDTSHGSTTTY